MPDISITVTDKRPVCTAGMTVVCDNSDYIVHWDLDEEWSAYDTKTMRVIYMDSTYADTVFTGDSVALPPVLVPGCVQIGLYAGDIHTSRMALLRALSSVRSASGAPANPTPDVYDQLMERMAQLETPDWNQNDPTAKDYIKNRTHWVDDDGTVHKLDEKFLPQTSAVSFAAQSLTDSQKAQARENIGAQYAICGRRDYPEETICKFVSANGATVELSKKLEVGQMYFVFEGDDKSGGKYVTATAPSEGSGMTGAQIFIYNNNSPIGVLSCPSNWPEEPAQYGGNLNMAYNYTVTIPARTEIEKIPSEYIPTNDFVVVATKDSDGNIALDKTYVEIQAAIEAGKNTYIRWSPDDMMTQLYSYIGTQLHRLAFCFQAGSYVELIFVGQDQINTEKAVLPPKDYVDSVALPAVTTSDNGKILKVVDGAWAVVDA